MTLDLEQVLVPNKTNNIASLVNTLRSITNYSYDKFKQHLHLSNQDFELLKSAKDKTIDNELFSINSLCKFYIFADSVQSNDWNSRMVIELSKHLKNVCKDELVKRSFIL